MGQHLVFLARTQGFAFAVAKEDKVDPRLIPPTLMQS